MQRTFCLILIFTTMAASVGYCAQTDAVAGGANSNSDNQHNEYSALLGALMNNEVKIKVVDSDDMRGILLSADRTNVYVLTDQQDTTLIPLDKIEKIERIEKNPIGKIIFFGAILPLSILIIALTASYSEGY